MAGVATAQKANNSAAPKPQKSNPFKILGLVGFIVAAIAGVYFKVNGGQAKVDPSAFPLGKYPLATKITASDFFKLIGSKNTGRPFNSVVLFNALDPGAGCPVCPTIDAAFKSVAAKVPASQQLKHKVTFATVDLSNSRELFQKLNIQTAPWLLFFKSCDAGQAPSEPVAFDIVKVKLAPETIADFVNKNLGAEAIPNGEKAARQAMLITVGSLIAGAIALAVTGRLTGVIYNPWIAMTLTTLFVLAMTSGLMFCRVRGINTNFFAYSSVANVAGNLNSQTGAEMWIIGATNLMSAIAIVLLGFAVPKIQNGFLQRLAALVCVSLLIYGYNSELAVFIKKFPNYPFRLFSK